MPNIHPSSTPTNWSVVRVLWQLTVCMGNMWCPVCFVVLLQITQELIAEHLSSSVVTAAVGPPDLCIRTSGEQRLSNFMLFESAYTELCFLDVLWPAFTKEHFAGAIQQYALRQRRYGRRK